MGNFRKPSPVFRKYWKRSVNILKSSENIEKCSQRVLEISENLENHLTTPGK